jgi:hypothetical protein
LADNARYREVLAAWAERDDTGELPVVEAG